MSSAAVPTRKSFQRPKILLLGDSLTQTSFEGWGAKLADVYQRRADIVNRGYSGYNTDFYLRLPLDDLASCEHTLVLIFFGANDAAIKEVDRHHHVSVEEYSKNLKTLLEQLRSVSLPPRCQDDILLITPPPVDHEQRLAYQIKKYGEKATGVLERTLENTGRYAESCQSVAKAANLPCLNLYDGMQKRADWPSFFHDGLHFSPRGHAYVGEALVDAINKHFPKWKVVPDPRTGFWANSGSACDGLSSQGPYHDEIDYKDADKAFLKYCGDP